MASTELANRAYPYGFVTDIESDSTPPGLSEDIVRLISAKKNESQFMLDWRLRAYRHWLTMERSAGEPRWANVTYPPIDYQKIVLLLGAQAEGGRAPRGPGPGDPSAPSRSSAARSTSRSGSPAGSLLHQRLLPPARRWGDGRLFLDIGAGRADGAPRLRRAVKGTLGAAPASERRGEPSPARSSVSYP